MQYIVKKYFHGLSDHSATMPYFNSSKRLCISIWEKKVEISFYCNFVKNTICFCNEFIVTLQILYKTYYEGADNKKLIILFVDWIALADEEMKTFQWTAKERNRLDRVAIEFQWY